MIGDHAAIMLQVLRDLPHNNGAAKSLNNRLDAIWRELGELLHEQELRGRWVHGYGKPGKQANQASETEGLFNDWIEGGLGDDVIFGDSARLYPEFEANTPLDQLAFVARPWEEGKAGRDTAGKDTVFGGEGNDLVFGQGGDDVIDGGAGNDTLYGGRGRDTITGGAGNDQIYGGPQKDEIRGGPGQNQVKQGGDEGQPADVTWQAARLLEEEDWIGQLLADIEAAADELDPNGKLWLTF